MEANAFILMLGGSETSSTALATATYFLTLHPGVLAKLTDEIFSAFQTEEDINVHSIQSLPYLSAVMDETLRINPPVPHPSPIVMIVWAVSTLYGWVMTRPTLVVGAGTSTGKTLLCQRVPPSNDINFWSAIHQDARYDPAAAIEATVCLAFRSCLGLLIRFTSAPRHEALY
jgi:hypothetical protein